MIHGYSWERYPGGSRAASGPVDRNLLVFQQKLGTNEGLVEARGDEVIVVFAMNPVDLAVQLILPMKHKPAGVAEGTRKSTSLRAVGSVKRRW